MQLFAPPRRAHRRQALPDSSSTRLLSPSFLDSSSSSSSLFLSTTASTTTTTTITSSSPTSTSSTLSTPFIPSFAPSTITPSTTSSSSDAPLSTSAPLPVVTGAASSPGTSPIVTYPVATSMASLAPTPTPTTARPSSPGFFSNTAAVAGTFTVVSLVAIAAIIAVALRFLRHRHSQSYDEDTEYLDKTPDLSVDPPAAHVTSIDHASSDNGHYTAPPMALAPPPTIYYPEHAYALHPHAFQTESYPQDLHPSNYTQDYPQHAYPPDDYSILYPHGFTNVQLDSATPTPTRPSLPSALRPSVKVTLTRANTRISVDSFYAGIPTDTPSSEQAI